MIDYSDALRAAGAEVHEFERFGSYQGTWCAKVTFEDKAGFVIGSFGSCSGCDSIQALYEYDSETGEYGFNKIELVEIGVSALREILSIDEVAAYFGDEPWGDDVELVAWARRVA